MVRVYQRGPSTGTSTGGGTGGGTGSTSGEYDRYIGTIGLAADAPKNALKPHYTKFPAADAGAWLRVVSETKIDNIDVLIGQNWMCTVDATPISTPKNWELTQVGTKLVQYPTHLSCIGTLKRTLDPTRQRTIPSGQSIFIPFYRPAGYGVFESLVANDKDSRMSNIDLYDLPLNGVVFDFTLSLQFAFDVSGDRGAKLVTYSYYPYDEDGNYDKFGTYLDTHLIETRNQAATATGPTDILLHRVHRIHILTEPIDDYPITEVIAASVSQNSGGPLDLTYAELTVVAWK